MNILNKHTRMIRIRGRTRAANVLAALFCLALLLSILIAQSVFATNNTAVNLSITRADDGSTVYMVGEQAYFTINIDSSGLDTEDILVNPALKLYFITSDTEGDSTSKAAPSLNIGNISSEFANGGRVTDNDNQVITWPLKDISGATEIGVSGSVSMPGGVTPYNYPLTLRVVLESEGRDPIEDYIVINWVYEQKTPGKSIDSGDYLSTAPDMDDGTKSFVVFGGNDTTGNGRIDDTYPVTFTFDNNTEEVRGSKVNDHIQIVDKLPEGAIFVESDNSPFWTYDPVSNTATYVGEDKETVLNLRFPNGVVGQDYTNTADYTYFPTDPLFDDPISYTRAVKVNVRLAGQETPSSVYLKTPVRTERGNKLSAPSGHASRLAVDEEITGDYWFSSSLANHMRVTPLDNVMISDDSLDDRLRFTCFSVSAEAGAIVGNAVIQYRLAGETAWHDYITITESDFTNHARPAAQLGTRAAYFNSGTQNAGCLYTDYYFLPDDMIIDGLRLRIDKQEPGSTVYFDTGAALRDGIAEGISKSNTTSFSNTTGFYYNWLSESSRTSIGGRTAYQDVVPYQPKFRGMKLVNGPVTGLADIYAGNTLTISNRLRYMDFDPNDTIDFNGAQIIDLLPRGMSYVPGSMTFTNLNGQRLDSHFANIEPIVVYDYNGTGMTALIWDLQGVVDVTWFKSEYLAYYSYKVEVNENCVGGVNNLYGYFHWPESSKIGANSNNQSATGIYRGYIPYTESGDGLLGDINHNGDTGETFLSCAVPMNYLPATGIVASKGAKGTFNSTWMYTPASGYSLADDSTSSSFKLEVINYSASTLDTLSIFDVLPYIGDVALVMNRDGVYVPRGSQFNITLTGPVVLADSRFTVYYSETNPSPWNGIEAYETSAVWVTEGGVGDWLGVRAFKIELVSGSVSPGERIDAVLPIRTPASGIEGAIAWNSYAINTGVSYLEALKAGIEIVTYDVSVEKDSDRHTYNSGQTVTYTISVKNNSKLSATNVTITDIIPEGLTFLGCDRPYDFEGATGLLTVGLETLMPWQSAVIKVTCRADHTDVPRVITNTAHVEISESEKDYSNNEDGCVIRVLPPVGSLVIRKTLAGVNEEWGVDNRTIFWVRVWDTTAGNYLIFNVEPEADGSYWCVGNNEELSAEGYTGLNETQIAQAVRDGVFTDMVPVTVANFVKVTNLWARRVYDIEEVFEDGESAPTIETGQYYWASYSGNGVELPENRTNTVVVTNTYEHGEGNLIIAKSIRGYNHDWGVSDITQFYALVYDVLSDDALGRDVPLVFEPIALSPNRYRCVGNLERLTEDIEGVLAFTEAAGEIAALIESGRLLSKVPFSSGQSSIVTNLWVWDGEPLIYRIEEVSPAHSPAVHYIGNNCFFEHETGETIGDSGPVNEVFAIENATVTVVNTYPRGTGDLIVRKEFADGGDHEGWGIGNGDTFRARVRDNTNGQYLAFEGSGPYSYAGSDEDGTFISFSFNSPARLTGIPVGTVCVVLEDEGINYSVSYDYGTAGARNIAIVNSELAATTPEVKVINNYEPVSVIATIDFTKLIVGEAGGSGTFTFVLTEVEDPDDLEVKSGGYGDVLTGVPGGDYSFTIIGLEHGQTYYYMIYEEPETPGSGWVYDDRVIVVEIAVPASGDPGIRALTDESSVTFTNRYDADAVAEYKYRIKYYKDSVDNSNLLGVTDGISEFPEGYGLKKADVDSDFGSAGWINARRPDNYRDGQVQSIYDESGDRYYPVITVDVENNLIIVLYVKETDGNTGGGGGNGGGGGGYGGGDEGGGGGGDEGGGGNGGDGDEGGGGGGQTEPPEQPEEPVIPEEPQGGGNRPNPPVQPGGNDRNTQPNPTTPANRLEPGDMEGVFIEYNEEGVPLGEWRWDNLAEMWVFEEYLPLADLPQTGRRVIPILPLLLFGAAMITTGVILEIRKTHERRKLNDWLFR